MTTGGGNKVAVFILCESMDDKEESVELPG